MKILVVDLGTSNIRSLSSALGFLGASHQLVTDPTAIPEATHVILPGVGAFDAAMGRIVELGLVDALRQHALIQRRPILGVCLGMQLLFDDSEEGQLPGLRLMPGRFRQLAATHTKKVPHVGFAPIYGHEGTGLFAGLEDDPYFYFTHSFALPALAGRVNAALCDHSSPFVAAFQQDSICGAQFHPEKSQSNGLRLLSNFLELAA